MSKRMWMMILVWLGVGFALTHNNDSMAQNAPTLTPTPCVVGYAACPPVTANDDWTPVEQTFEDDVPMVMVPVGCFMMGSEDGDDDEQPAHQICFEAPFWIDQYEVSNGQFSRLNGQAARLSTWTEADLPRERISWFEARDFCDLRGARLPTEAEWEYAARGPDSLIYPWGNDYDGSRLNACDKNCPFEDAELTVDDGVANTAPIGSYPDGVSWVGAYDLSGNVAEWVNTIIDPDHFAYPYDATDGRESATDTESFRGLRGGAWDGDLLTVRAAGRLGYVPEGGDFIAGFRCARS